MLLIISIKTFLWAVGGDNGTWRPVAPRAEVDRWLGGQADRNMGAAKGRNFACRKQLFNIFIFITKPATHLFTDSSTLSFFTKYKFTCDEQLFLMYEYQVEAFLDRNLPWKFKFLESLNGKLFWLINIARYFQITTLGLASEIYSIYVHTADFSSFDFYEYTVKSKLYYETFIVSELSLFDLQLCPHQNQNQVYFQY